MFHEQEVLDRLSIVQVDVACKSGTVSKTDASHSGSDVFTDGSVRYLDRKLLRPFSRARQAAVRVCRENGTKMLGGWAVPDSRLDFVRRELEEVARAADADKASFTSTLRTNREQWEQQHPEVLAFASRFPTDHEILDGIHFQATIYKIHPQDTGTIDDGLTDLIGSFAAHVLEEVAQDAKDAYNPQALKASARAKNVLKRISLKLASLSFVDSSLGGVAHMIDKVLAALPEKGALQGKDFAMYAGMMAVLMDPSKVLEMAEMEGAVSITSAVVAMSPFGDTFDMPVPEASSEPAVAPAPPASPAAVVEPDPGPAFEPVFESVLETGAATTEDDDVLDMPPPHMEDHSMSDPAAWQW